MNKKAQGTIEYLVIIAVVVIISLVVVGMLITQTSSVSATDQKTTNLAWKTKELQVMDFAADADGKGTVIVNSNLPEGVIINSIVIGDSTDLSTKQIFLGSVKKFSLTNLFACTSQNQKYTITINYTTREGLTKSVSGEFYANCVSNALTLEVLGFIPNQEGETGTNTGIISGYFTLTNPNAISTDSLDDFTNGTNSDNQLTIVDGEIKLKTN